MIYHLFLQIVSCVSECLPTSWNFRNSCCCKVIESLISLLFLIKREGSKVRRYFLPIFKLEFSCFFRDLSNRTLTCLRNENESVKNSSNSSFNFTILQLLILEFNSFILSWLFLRKINYRELLLESRVEIIYNLRKNIITSVKRELRRDSTSLILNLSHHYNWCSPWHFFFILQISFSFL